ncbi:hypothetical protein QFW96_06170 [Saccharopolyspora sp. TS4A08]|uniref:Uncharacterized protein n=1 Tax=Saccharopolyspora ipomoeae TaxID=3042027 RepID=A0ABT6PK02_9PSEU|nr:hypothetical protein [Saccharopolyspora sp. TS4A08]MDI2028185.1 hypothetical protein [Saccharopolyspora sp. TS4A08]
MIVAPGRGESRATCTRFARRLATDANLVQVLAAPRVEDGSSSLELAEVLTTAADGFPRPVVIVGSETSGST